MTFCCLMGLLAVGMMTVHWKREIRTIASGIRVMEYQLEDLGRRQDILDTEMAHALNPECLKELIAVSNLRLVPPQENHIIVVRSMDKPPQSRYYQALKGDSRLLRPQWELVDIQPRSND